MLADPSLPLSPTPLLPAVLRGREIAPETNLAQEKEEDDEEGDGKG
jgi:hypothetical protein